MKKLVAALTVMFMIFQCAPLDTLADLLPEIEKAINTNVDDTEEVTEISPSPAPTASPIPPALASDDDATDRVYALEFCELYMKRVMEFNEKYGRYYGDLNTMVISPGALEQDDTYKAFCSSGALTLNKEDLTIESMTFTMMDLDADDAEGNAIEFGAVLTISALEMTDIEADGLDMLHRIDPDQPEDAFIKYVQEYNDVIDPALYSKMDKLTAGDEVLVYQGNYDYYAYYRYYSDSGIDLYLRAEARE